jgi:hypothetical protein
VAYAELVEFVADRRRSRCRTYPRTFLALLGEDDLRDRGWLTAWMRSFVVAARAERGYFFQPWDEAGRPHPRDRNVAGSAFGDGRAPSCLTPRNRFRHLSSSGPHDGVGDEARVRSGSSTPGADLRFARPVGAIGTCEINGRERPAQRHARGQPP